MASMSLPESSEDRVDGGLCSLGLDNCLRPGQLDLYDTTPRVCILEYYKYSSQSDEARCFQSLASRHHGLGLIPCGWADSS